MVALRLTALLAAMGICLPALADELAGQAPEAVTRAIEKAAPDKSPAKPKQARRILLYGRAPTHADAFGMARVMVEALGTKTGAYQTTFSSDPSAFDAENLNRFDAVVLNNTHEADPMLPWGWKSLRPEELAQARAKSAEYYRNLVSYVESGHGVVGLHAANAGVKSNAYNQLIGGAYAAHLGGPVFIKVDEPGHPLCASLDPKGFGVSDEVYVFREPYSRERVRVLLSIDLSRTQHKDLKPGGDYPISWVRTQGKGRVFYSSLPAHNGATYQYRPMLQHILAGIQFAIGDLDADASPSK